MGQQDVYSILKKNKGRWLSAKEISNSLDTSFYALVSNLKRLREANIIISKTVNKVVKPAGKRLVYVYKYKG